MNLVYYAMVTGSAVSIAALVRYHIKQRKLSDTTLRLARDVIKKEALANEHNIVAFRGRVCERGEHRIGNL